MHPADFRHTSSDRRSLTQTFLDPRVRRRYQAHHPKTAPRTLLLLAAMAEELRTSCALYAYSAAARSCSEGVVTVKALHAEAPRAAAGGESGEKPAKALRVERAPSAEAATTEGAAGQEAAKAEACLLYTSPSPRD